jgi:PAS domain S-box-containing protein
LSSEPSAFSSFRQLLRSDPYRDFFHALADSLDDAVILAHQASLKIEAVNHTFILLSGYARSEIIGQELAALFIDHEDLLPSLQQCREGSSVERKEICLKLRDGGVLPIDLAALPVGSARPFILIHARAANIRRQQEAEEKAQSEQLESLSEMTSLLLEGTASSLPSVLDIAERLLCTDSLGVYRLSASTPDYILDGDLPDSFPKELSAATIEPPSPPGAWTLGQRPGHHVHKWARAGGLRILHSTPVGSSKAWVGLLLAGWRAEEAVPPDAEQLMTLLANLVHLAILLGLQRATVADGEQILKRLEAEIRDQFAAVNDTLLALDRDLTIVRANPAIERLLGYQPEEVVGREIQDVLVGPEDVRSLLLDALGHQRVAEQSRMVLHRRDGSSLPVQIRAVPLSGQRQTQLLLILKDQSEQKAIEDQTEILAQRALLGEVTAIFAHEVRNPINNISTGAQLVASRLGEDHPLHDSLVTIRNECNRLDQLMSDVLFFARPLELKMEPIDLQELMDRILTRWKPRLNRAGVQSHTSYHPEAPKALADPRTLEQVIVNLITNAIQAMTQGGTLSVTLVPVEGSSEGQVALKIADTGPGIPEDLIERIFDPFFTTKKEGTGLGLAISRRILTAHRGQLQVESYPDAGTVFTIFLPVAAQGKRGPNV